MPPRKITRIKQRKITVKIWEKLIDSRRSIIMTFPDKEHRQNGKGKYQRNNTRKVSQI
jgi:hypothetical protein